MRMAVKDPEIRDLQIATARALAIAERLACELDDTVTELMKHVGERPRLRPVDVAVVGRRTKDRSKQ